MPHPVGVVIGEGVVIGANARIYQHTTFGGRIVGDMQRNAYPRIGDNVTAFAGAVMVGAITMGDRCIVGANAVVLDSFGDDCTLVGAPARATLTPAARRLAATQADRNAAGGA